MYNDSKSVFLLSQMHRVIHEGYSLVLSVFFRLDAKILLLH